MSSSAAKTPSRTGPKQIGRYLLFECIAQGGMAQVHLGRLVGPVGFSRIVAIKRLHPHLTREPEFVSMFLDEARLAARIRHPNVVPILDVVSLPDELFLVLEYVAGESLANLARSETQAGQRIPPDIASAILLGVLAGLHAAHEARSESGAPLRIVHRDVSPQNVMVGEDGLVRVLDFGIAHAAERLSLTRVGEVKGKPGYMSPEQIAIKEVDRRTDVYATGVMAWELLTGRRLFAADGDLITFDLVRAGAKQSVRDVVPTVPAAVDAVVMKSIAVDPAERYQSARDFALALEQALPPASQRAVTEWVERVAGNELADRAKRVARIESGERSTEEPVAARVSRPELATDIATEHGGLGSELPPSGAEITLVQPSSGAAAPRASEEAAAGTVTATRTGHAPLASLVTDTATIPSMAGAAASSTAPPLPAEAKTRPVLASAPELAAAAATASPSAEAPRARERVWLALGGTLLGAVFFCAIVLVGLAVRSLSSDATPASSAPSGSPSDPATRGTAAPETPMPTADADVAPLAQPPATVSGPVASGAPSGAASSAGKTGVEPSGAGGPAPTSKPSGSRAGKNPCDPPFTYRGRVKVPKPECF